MTTVARLVYLTTARLLVFVLWWGAGLVGRYS